MRTVQTFQQMPDRTNVSGWMGLMEDLQHLSLETSKTSAEECSENVAELFLTNYAIADSFNIDVLSHQLYVLSEEYPNVHMSLKTAVDEWTNSGLNDVILPDSFINLAIVLLELSRLETSHASSVKACRARDGSKGREVIPDYDRVNSAGADTLSDPIVSAALTRASDVCDAVAFLTNSNGELEARVLHTDLLSRPSM
jgi:hypothetical protein